MTGRSTRIGARLRWAVEELGQDLRHAARQLRRAPGLAVATAAILSLVLTTGATLLSLTNALVFRPLPVTDAGRLAAVSLTDVQVGGMRLFDYQTFRRFVAAQSVLDGAFGFRGSGLLPVQVGDRLSDGVIAAITPEAFTTFGLIPALGRVFTAEDAPETGEPARVGLISHRLWMRLFDGRPDAIGDTLDVRGRPITVIGVMAESFAGFEPHSGSDLYVPLTLLPHLLEQAPVGSPNPRLSHVVGRLKNGVTLEQAQAAVETMWPTLQDPPTSDPATERAGVAHASGGFSSLRPRVAQPLLMLSGLAMALALLGCVNLYGLASSRSVAGEGQVAVLLALGAPRYRLIRVFMCESVLVASVVSLVVVLVTPLMANLAVALLWQGNVPLATSVAPGGALIASTVATTFMSCLVVGVLPALPSLSTTSGIGLRRRASSIAMPRGSAGLIVVQVALSLVLVTTAGLFATSLMELRSIDTGFRPTGLVFGRAWQLPGLERTYDEQTHYPELVSRLEALPNVDSVALAHYFPGYLGFTGLSLEGAGLANDTDPAREIPSLLEFVSPRFFDTVGSTILKGRDFSWSDRLGTAPVVVISEALERQLFPLDDALGARIRIGADPSRQMLEVIGVSADVTVGNLRSPHLPTAFRPRMQETTRQRIPILLIKTARDADAMFRPIDTVVRAMGHERMRTLQTIDEELAATLQQERLMAGTSASFGGVAAGVTLIGLYALLAHAVSRRTRDIGVRLAIGASRLHVIGSVLRRAVGLTATGVVIGVPAAMAAGRLIESQLYGVRPGNPWVLGASAGLFLIVAALAAFLPARQAARVNPVVALRAD